jgi:hypothetical protein
MVVYEEAKPSLGKPSSSSAVLSREEWLNRMDDVEADGVLGLTTMVATCQPISVTVAAQSLLVPPSLSSKVTNTAVVPEVFPLQHEACTGPAIA